MAFVIDASATMPWILKNDASGYADEVLHSLNETDAIAPDLWLLEIGNVLVVYERRGRIAVDESTRFTNLLLELPISIDDGTQHRVFSKIINVAREFEVSCYDATYIELAMRESIPMATLDQGLRTAAQQAGVDIVGL